MQRLAELCFVFPPDGRTSAQHLLEAQGRGRLLSQRSLKVMQGQVRQAMCTTVRHADEDLLQQVTMLFPARV